MKNFLCCLGLHNYKQLTNKGCVIYEANSYDPGNPFDPSQYLHVKKCKRCGKISSFVKIIRHFNSFTDIEIRDATNDELVDFLNNGCD